MSHNKEKIQQYVQEFLRCRNDFEYFCRNYVLLELTGGDQYFDPYEKQIELVDTIQEKKNVIVLKSRQIGISTITQAYCAWLVTFYKNVVIGLISKDSPEATSFAKSINNMLTKLPSWMGVKFTKDTERSFILKNGSKLYASPVPPNQPEKTLRGKTITFLVIDEAAFTKYIDDAWTSIVPALSTNQKQARMSGIPYGTVILSTPNKTVGVGEWFYRKWVNANSGSNDSIYAFTPFQIHWSEIPQLANDPHWYKQQCEMLDNDHYKIQQELELKFVSTSGTFFSEETIEKLQEAPQDPIEEVHIHNGKALTFKKPIQGKHYLIGVDSAPEHGSDKSAITVWDYETLEQVWEYQGKCKVGDLSKIVESVATMYNNSTIVVESNSYGNQVIEELNKGSHSTKLYKEKRGENKLVPGLSTNSKTRPLMIDALYSYITQYPEIVKSKRLVLELIGLITKNNGRVEADQNSHDDLCLSSSFCMYVRKYDSPLMLNINQYQENSFMDIMNMNMPNSEFSNREIKKRTNELLEEGKGGNINTFDFFDFSQ